MKRSRQPAEQPDGNKKLRQCLIGRTRGNVLDVVGADGWLGKGATVTKVLKNSKLRLSSDMKKKTERTLKSYFSTIKPPVVATIGVRDVTVTAADEVEKTDIPVVESNSKPLLNQEQIVEDLRQEPFLVPKENVVKCNQQNLQLPSFEDEDFDFDLGPARVNYLVQRNAPDNVEQSVNEILTLDD